MNKKAWYRADIQGLRCIAVLAVIVFHFFPALLPSGFLGVDVFFVISGFVISRLFIRNENRQPFDFLSSFYVGRIKRLYPALVVCVLITGALFAFFTSRVPEDSLRTGAFSIFGVSNIYLWKISTDYFATVAQLNPFTQTWSLGVEEQFYILFPIILIGSGFFKKSIYSYKVMLFCALGSLAGYIVWIWISPSAQFYLMPFRFWQFSLGYFVAVCEKKVVGTKSRSIFNLSEVCSWVCFLLILAGFFFPAGWKTYSTIWITFATGYLLVRLRDNKKLVTLLSSRPACFIGDISYSLYLWHWSILVLGRWLLGTSLFVSCLLLALTFIVSAGSYFVIEQPIRRVSIDSGFKKIALVSCTVFVSIVCFFFMLKVQGVSQSYNNRLANFFQIPQPKNWSPVLCHGKEAIRDYLDPYSVCLGAERTKQKPSVLYLIGDSHAAQLTFMLEVALRGTQYQLRFIDPDSLDGFPAAYCNSSSAESPTISFILDNMKKRDVLMATFHRGHLNAVRDQHMSMSVPFSQSTKSKTFVASFSKVVQTFVRKGGNVILVDDTPLMNIVASSPSCYAQKKFFGECSCTVSKKQDFWTRKNQTVAFDQLQKIVPNIVRWDPSEIMYNDQLYFEVTNDDFTYRMSDWNHITMRESRNLAPFFVQFLRKNNYLKSYLADGHNKEGRRKMVN